MIPVMVTQGEFTSYIRTGGTWVADAKLDDHVCWSRSNPCGPNWHGHYEGGTREPGRFTPKLAPASPVSRAWKWEGIRVPPAPCYDTPADVTARAREAGTMAMVDWIPVKEEALGVKFIKALNALPFGTYGDGWERTMLTNVETPWGETGVGQGRGLNWRNTGKTSAIPDIKGARKTRRKAVAA